MSDGPVQLALRELRTTYSDRTALAVMGAVGVVAGLAGPFNTFEMLNLPLRLIYWLAIAFGTYAAGLAGAVILGKAVLPHAQPQWLSIAIQGLGGAVPVTILVVAINLALLPVDRVHISDAAWLFPYCLAICTALMALMQLVLEPRLRVPDRTPQEVRPPLLDRLSHEMRGPLSHLSMSDHYVEVFTTRGKTMVLMRLADAIRETGDVPGLQIHRSHWVAKDAVKAIRRIEGKTMIETKTGALLPVSRTYLPAVRAALT